MTKSYESIYNHLVEYLIQMRPETLKSAFDSNKVKQASKKSNCRLEVENEMVSRLTAPGHITHFSIVRVYGPNKERIDQFNKIVEHISSAFRLRKIYIKKLNKNSITDHKLNHKLNSTAMTNSGDYVKSQTKMSKEVQINHKIINEEIKSCQVLFHADELTQKIPDNIRRDPPEQLLERSTSDDTVFKNVSLEVTSLYFAHIENDKQLLEILEQRESPTRVQPQRVAVNDLNKCQNVTEFNKENESIAERDSGDESTKTSSPSCSLNLDERYTWQEMNLKEDKAYTSNMLLSKIVESSENNLEPPLEEKFDFKKVYPSPTIVDLE